MIDLAVLQAAAEGGAEEERVPISRRALRQIVRELSAARAMTAGQQQMDAVINNIRYEGRVGRRGKVSSRPRSSMALDTSDAD